MKTLLTLLAVSVFLNSGKTVVYDQGIQCFTTDSVLFVLAPLRKTIAVFPLSVVERCEPHK